MQHPEEFHEGLPDRLPAEEVRALQRIEPAKALAAIAAEWLMMAGAMALSSTFWHPTLYLAVLVFIGARQHALLIIGHDASHYTLLPDRRWNDWIADLLLFWPMFAAVDTYRLFHRDHHRYLATERDGNRVLWRTHDAAGAQTREWTYPKTVTGLVLTLLRKLLFLRGALWVLRGFLAPLVKGSYRRHSWWYVVARISYFGVIAALLTRFGVWREFLLYWLAPYCSWHIMIEYVRLICEHSAIASATPPYHLTRTVLPRLWERWLIVPRNVGYHHEHHWYPGVPFYNLPRLHALLRAETRFGQMAEISPGVMVTLRGCARRREVAGKVAMGESAAG